MLDDGAPDSSWVAGCLQERLARGLPQNRVLDDQPGRDRFFPRLEPGTVPRDDAAVARMLEHAATRDRLADERLHYVFKVGLTEERAGDGVEQVIAMVETAACHKLADALLEVLKPAATAR